MVNYDFKKMYDWPLTAQIGVILLIGGLVLYGGYMFDINPMYQQIEATKKLESQVMESFKAKVNEHMATTQTVLNVPHLQKTLSTWHNYFPAANEVPALQNNILKLGEANQLKISNFTPGSNAKVESYEMLPIKIAAIGNYNQIATYMSQIANIGKVVVVGDFDLETSVNETSIINNSDTIVNANMMIEIYEKKS